MLASGLHSSKSVPCGQVLDLAHRDPPVPMIVRGREQSANPTYNCYRCKDDGWVQLLGLETR